jgi:hypothetical protein
MIVVLLVLVVFLVILWSKVNQSSLRFGVLENHINLLEKKMADLAHRAGSAPQFETAEERVLANRPRQRNRLVSNRPFLSWFHPKRSRQYRKARLHLHPLGLLQ